MAAKAERTNPPRFEPISIHSSLTDHSRDEAWSGVVDTTRERIPPSPHDDTEEHVRRSRASGEAARFCCELLTLKLDQTAIHSDNLPHFESFADIVFTMRQAYCSVLPRSKAGSRDLLRRRDRSGLRWKAQMATTGRLNSLPNLRRSAATTGWALCIGAGTSMPAFPSWHDSSAGWSRATRPLTPHWPVICSRHMRLTLSFTQRRCASA